ncbi:MAG: RodZ domain-containing protein [Sulfuricella sp.]
MTEEAQDGVAGQQDQEKLSPGRMLAEARERAGLSVDEVARQLRLAPRQVEALESDDHAKLPGNTFVRGFLRNYAKLLQIDPEPLLAGSQEMQAQTQDQLIVVPSSSVEFGGKQRLLPFSDRPHKSWPKFAAAIIVAALFLSWGVFELIQRQQQPPHSEPVKSVGETALSLPLPQPQEEIKLPALPEPATKQETQPAQTPAPISEAAVDTGGQLLSFAFDEDAWVEVKDKNGKIVFHQLNPKGSQQSVRGTPPFSLTVGNAAHVRLSYNGKPVDLAPHVKVDVARLILE